MTGMVVARVDGRNIGCRWAGFNFFYFSVCPVHPLFVSDFTLRRRPLGVGRMATKFLPFLELASAL